VKRLFSLTAAAIAMTAAAVALLAAGASAASLPTLDIELTGTKGVAVSGSTVSGAVSIVSTFKGRAPKGPGTGPGFGLVHLNPGASLQQAANAVESHHGDINALRPYGTLYVDASAPGTVQTVLTPGSWVALNLTSQNGTPGVAPFTVSQSSSPAALPAARATETAID
jgi:hypothetical protein